MQVAQSTPEQQGASLKALADECEVSGDVERAGQLHQSRLVASPLPQVRCITMRTF